MSNPGFACPFCNHPAAHPVDVHGHVQCSICRTNVDPCCGGAPCPVPGLGTAPSGGDDTENVSDA